MRVLFLYGVAVAGLFAMGACGGGTSSQPFGGDDGGGAGGDSGGAGGDSGNPFGDSGSGGDSGSLGDSAGLGDANFGDGGSFGDGGGDSGPMQDAVVYGHSATVLYRVDPITKAVSVVGPFQGCNDSVIDLALDKDSNMFVTTFSGFFKVDRMNATCTPIKTGAAYPNSLSFVPKGTVDPNVEALVAYQGSTYVRIDTTTGAISNIGAIGGGLTSSGDIVSVIGGGTYLTVKGGSCNDCIVEVNPATGALVKDYGSVGHVDVFGLAFWAGVAYGFDNGGEIFSITFNPTTVTTTAIPVPNPPPGLSFYGAGSTTSAPPSLR